MDVLILNRYYYYYYYYISQIHCGKKKRWRLYILPQYLANQAKPTRHMERYGLMAVVPTLTALLLSSLNNLQFFFVFLYALRVFVRKVLWVKYQSPSFS